MKTIFSFNLKFIVILFILVIESKNCIAQKNEPWIRFFDTTNNKSGYKDLKGNVKITPKFDGFTRADTFYNIIGAYEMFEKELHAFYVLKNGRKLAKDSVFGIEGSPDCESEEKIIFSDWKKDKVGFLNKNGKVIVPAIYNWVQPFRNGISVALRNAKRECIPEGKDSISCEHSYFKGGETVLINERNEILVDSVNVENIGSINWYSKIISKKISDTTIYVSLKGKNNMFYSFIDYTKEFKNRSEERRVGKEC